MSQAATIADYDRDLEALTNQYDWLVYVNVDHFTHYLNYPTSSLTPVDRFTVVYRKTAAAFVLRSVQAPTFEPFKYEEFWYHGGRAIGLRRYQDAPMPQNEQGAIFFRYPSQTDVSNYPAATANCAARLLMETLLKRSIVAAVIVPGDCFEQISDALRTLAFLPVQRGSGGNDQSLTLRLLSEPPGMERYFYYDETTQ
jgi:hypothetical protein